MLNAASGRWDYLTFRVKGRTAVVTLYHHSVYRSVHTFKYRNGRWYATGFKCLPHPMADC